MPLETFAPKIGSIVEAKAGTYLHPLTARISVFAWLEGTVGPLAGRGLVDSVEVGLGAGTFLEDCSKAGRLPGEGRCVWMQEDNGLPCHPCHLLGEDFAV